MRISITTDSGLSARAASAGFTLIEILVVLVLIAITTTLVMVNLAPDEHQRLRTEGTRLALLLEQTRDEAIGTGASLAWQSNERGYQFMRRTPERLWQILLEDPFRMRLLDGSIRISAVEIAGQAIQSAVPLVFSPMGTVPPFRIHMASEHLRLRVRADNAADVLVEDE